MIQDGYHTQTLYSVNMDAGLFSSLKLEANCLHTVLFPMMQIIVSCLLSPHPP